MRPSVARITVEFEEAGSDLQKLISEGNGVDGKGQNQADIEDDKDPAARWASNVSSTFYDAIVSCTLPLLLS